MSVPFSVVMSGAKARKAARRDEHRAKVAALRASVAARHGEVRSSLDKKSIEAERYKRQMGLL